MMPSRPCSVQRVPRRTSPASATRRSPLAGAVVAMALLLVAGSACTSSPGSAADTPAESSVLVEVAIVRLDTLRETLLTFGTVVPAPGSARVFTAPFESIVSRLHVSRGQRVVVGQRLADIVPSPEARLMFESARSAATSERGRMSDVQQRLQLGLTTRDELLLQERALADADARWNAYAQWVDGLHITAASNGVVDRLPVSEGQRVPAGDLIVSSVAESRFEIALGIEPEDAPLVTPGLPVSVERLAGDVSKATIAGKVRSVSMAVDSATRLTSALVSPDVQSHTLLLGEYVRASVGVRSANGLVVPRSSWCVAGGPTADSCASVSKRTRSPKWPETALHLATRWSYSATTSSPTACEFGYRVHRHRPSARSHRRQPHPRSDGRLRGVDAPTSPIDPVRTRRTGGGRGCLRLQATGRALSAYPVPARRGVARRG